MKEAHMRCYNYTTEDCSKEAHEAVGLDYKETMRCVSASFAGGKIDSYAENMILEQNAK